MLNIKKCIHQRIKKWAQKTKAKYEYIRIWLTNLKIKKERNRTFVLAIKVLICSRAQRLLICSKTSEASTLHVTGHLMLKKAETIHPKQTNQINKIQKLL